MLLSADPSLAEVPDVSPEQLASLTASVERKQQQLEADIHDYIRRKQDELRSYGREVVHRQRAMECTAPRRESGARDLKPSPPTAASPHSRTPRAPSPPADASTEAKTLGPGETAKRTKHTRVHKREKELYGLVTPIFLPLLESGDSSLAKKKKEKKRPKDEIREEPATPPLRSDQPSPPRDAEKSRERRRSRSKNPGEKMEHDEESVTGKDSARDSSKSESAKKMKRSPAKKSSLRHSTSQRSRRKRVSLVIDDQIVNPRDDVVEPALTSPSETSASTASTSTTSLDDMIDPRLVPRHDTPVHQDPVHHSLPVPMGLTNMSPTKHTGHSLSASPSPLDYEPPQAATRTFLNPSPPNTSDMIMPQHASASPIYADRSEIADELETHKMDAHDDFEDRIGAADRSGEGEEDFDTYVGGITGSGVDDVDQAGSYGYPSSLGASYLESYMKSRPLSVRIAAAEKAGLGDGEKKDLVSGAKEKERDKKDKDKEKPRSKEKDREREKHREKGKGRERGREVDEDMEIMGDMEGF
ncbi:hypothetical protein K491DRAFT_595379 [Lophiostoma macrostomum CBS 122681]|uniref:Uncharacterized protein n=1 Tax=Lophiostoma macrostomum CBS 122681 TaxID=1314788 RepID=A0A6A6TE11_9PLEO|nr:hypothetical protein K491DRAFT_595379 [Lophiostoma macrostomum CBS 122681]